MSGYLAASPETSRMSMPGSLSRTNSARTGSRASGLISGSEPSPSCRHISDTQVQCSPAGRMSALPLGNVASTTSYYFNLVSYKCSYEAFYCQYVAFFVTDFHRISDLPALHLCTFALCVINIVLLLLFQMKPQLHIFVRATPGDV